ncbi:GNAT family N-acetyltransferase [Neobacillus niacini]|uniref:GNAT family N-acetyltransferase n=1 Tax=Neobacillus niacini TaxID=86668 RepID=UPI0021CB6C0E|nr:GNAT family N-acetyltransferase [Neobacillus niacini]MCM3766377.1 GNAT family N-acetyltransferase [Neobacillus niacini]
MADLYIVDGGINELKNVYQLFAKDFPIEERKTYDQLEFLLSKKKYKLLVAKQRNNNELVGYAFIYELEQVNAIWLDYMAVNKEFRNKGYGAILLNHLAQYKQDGLGLFFEVEIPVEGENKNNQLRRIHFYERLGAKKLEVGYEFPTSNGGFPMYLFFKASSDLQKLSSKLIREAIAEAFEEIHIDVKNREQILAKVLSTIEDC